MEQRPLYEMVADSIRKLLIQNHLQEGEILPGEFELMKEYGVGRETIRRALKILVEEGLIIRRPGKGTKVCRRIKPDNIEKVVSFSSEIMKLGMVPSTKIKFIRSFKRMRNWRLCYLLRPVTRLYLFDESAMPMIFPWQLRKDLLIRPF